MMMMVCITKKPSSSENKAQDIVWWFTFIQYSRAMCIAFFEWFLNFMPTNVILVIKFTHFHSYPYITIMVSFSKWLFGEMSWTWNSNFFTRRETSWTQIKLKHCYIWHEFRKWKNSKCRHPIQWLTHMAHAQHLTISWIVLWWLSWNIFPSFSILMEFG